jgi:hypothetical protein
VLGRGGLCRAHDGGQGVGGEPCHRGQFSDRRVGVRAVGGRGPLAT